MVLGRDKYLPCSEIPYRMVAAAMAVGELDRLSPQGQTEQLVAEANAEDRHGAVGELAYRLDGITDRRRIARAVGEEHPVGLEVAHPGGRRARRDNGHASVVGAEDTQDVPLHPVIV